MGTGPVTVNTPFMLQRIMLVLDVTDMKRSVAFYREKLGFSARSWANPPDFTIVQRGAATLALNLNTSTQGSRNAYWSAFINVHDAREVYDEFIARGVSILRQLEVAFYGCRDFDAKDPDRHILAFGTPHDNRGRDIGPDLKPDQKHDAITPETAT